MLSPVREGDVCRTSVPRGISGTFINKCPFCQSWLSSADDPICKSCSASFRTVSDGVQMVVRRGTK